jgi:hypothetical protein
LGTLPFKQLPLAVKIAVGVAFNNAWWSIEEFVINRRGLWKYMPYYKVADACVWDLMVAVVTTLAIWRASTRGVSRSLDELREERP